MTEMAASVGLSTLPPTGVMLAGWDCHAASGLLANGMRCRLWTPDLSASRTGLSKTANSGSGWGDMPSVLRTDGYRFFFYSDEGNPREPPHIHAVSGEKTAKFWLDPVELVNSKRLSASEIGAVHRLVTRHRDTFLEAWHAHFDA